MHAASLCRRRLLATVVACTSALLSLPASAQQAAAEARAAYLRGDYVEAARKFEEASAANPELEHEYRLAAAEAAIKGGDAPLAASLVASLSGVPLHPAQTPRLQLVRARIALLRGRPFAALQALPQPHASPAWSAPEIEALRADTLFALGDPVRAVQTLVQREQWLDREDAIRQNRERLWLGLTAAPLPEGAERDIASQDAVTRGWLELALALEQAQPVVIEAWRRRYPSHPANMQLQQLAIGGYRPGQSVPAFAARPAGSGPYALLLPLSGAYRATGEALRDGFIATQLRTGDPAAVRIYDSGTAPEQAVAAYRQALREGAGIIVGPLPKDALTAVARQGVPPVPLVGLNYLDDVSPPGVMQLGLAPEDEARAAARLAAGEGRRRIVALVPEGDWGQRVVSAFEAELAQHGGTLLAVVRYPPGEVDYAPAVRRLIDFEASQARHDALTAVLGQNTVFQARRRQDVDGIFLGARASEAQLIVPQLRFFGASSLPTYAVSVIYQPGASGDLDGLRFCDMPWMLQPAGELGAEAAESAALFGGAGYDPRLFALGADAYRVARAVRDGAALSDFRLSGATGLLQLSPSGRFSRALGCGRLQAGTAVDATSP